MSYPVVKIHNSTSFIAKGKVSYMSLFCSDDNYSVTPDTTWTAKSRGVCLLTKITATVKTPEGDFVASPYTSSGTSYSNFAVISTGKNKFAVTRIVTAVTAGAPEEYVEEVELPEDYVEPTTNQK